MRRITLLIFTALLLLSVSLTSAQQTPEATSQPAAPSLQVVDSAPAAGEELGLNQPIVIYFDRAVDCASAQAAFQIAPQAVGSVSCDPAASSITFTPSGNYTRATAYTITVGSTIKGADGSTLAEPFALQLSTVGFLEVSQVLPADKSDGVDTNSAITVIFNRPVVPLTVAEDSSTLPQPLTFSTAVEGKGEWLNTSIYVFHPNPALQGGTKYTITVDGSLTAVDGAAMEKPFVWSFTTAAPIVSEVVPNDTAMDVVLDTSIQVKFNQPMNRQSVEANFSLHPFDVASQKVAGTFTWADDGAGFMFKPDANLTIDTHFVAEFTSAPLPEGGGAALTGQMKWDFGTVPLPSVISTDPSDGLT